MRNLLIGTMCLMLVALVGTSLAGPEQAGGTCATATVVTTIPYTDSGVLDATDDCVGRPYFDVFYVLTAPTAGAYTFDMCNSDGDTYFKIWTGGTCCSGTSVTGDDECGGMDPLIQVALTLNQVVYIECGFYSSAGGTGSAYIFNVQGPPVPTPGDNCANPKTVSLPSALPYADLGQHTCGRIDDYNATCLGYYDGGEDIIYEVTVTATVTVDISVTSTTTYIGICIDDMCPPDLTCIAMSTNSGSGTQTMSNVNLTPGTYYIMVDTWPSPTCIPSFDLNIVNSPPPPPTYYWRNNCSEGTGNPCGPAYNWVTVTTNALPCSIDYTYQNGILGDDDWEGPYPIGFMFNYYGVDYTQFTISSNGFLMLGTTGSTSYNVCIPSNAVPNNVLAWFWDDLHPGYIPSTVYYGNANVDGQYAMVVTFNNVPLYGSYTATITAQVILKSNGNIKYQYNTIDAGFGISGSTIGIENQTGLFGVNYLCNGTPSYCFMDGLAIEFGTNPDALPVELTSFDAAAMNEAVRLAWVTASETNNDHFVLYRSTSQNGEFTQIASIEGASASATENRYNYVDRNLTNGVTYYYRLADVDINGNVTTHDLTVSATPARGAMGMLVTEYKLHQNYPNPFNPNTTIIYDVKETGNVTLKIYNLLGREVATLVDEVKDNNRYQVTFDASGLAAGVYFYRVNVNDFSSVHKMILLK